MLFPATGEHKDLALWEGAEQTGQRVLEPSLRPAACSAPSQPALSRGEPARGSLTALRELSLGSAV